VPSARECARSLARLGITIVESPKLQGAYNQARDILVTDWTTRLREASGVLEETEMRAFVEELGGFPSVGGRAAALIEFARALRALDAREKTSDTPSALLQSAHSLASRMSTSANAPAWDSLQPCFDAIRSGYRSWCLESLPQILERDTIGFDELCSAEKLLEYRDLVGPETRTALGAGHLKRAKTLSGGGAGSVLALLHLNRAKALGAANDSARFGAIESAVLASIQSAELFPEVSIGVDFQPSVDAWMLEMLSKLLRDAIVAKTSDSFHWRWVDPREEPSDVLLTVETAEFVMTAPDELPLVSSTYFSHFQDVPNPYKNALGVQVNLARIAVNYAESSYDSEVSSFNLWPTDWGLMRVNQAYSNYSLEVDDYNRLVDQYNSTPDTVSQEVYLPYSYREGNVSIGWRLRVGIAVGKETQASQHESIASDFVRLGTNRADKSEARRRDDALEIAFSVESGLTHLLTAIDSVCEDFYGPLVSIRRSVLQDVSEDEERAIGWAMHPWGASGMQLAELGLPPWLDEANQITEPLTFPDSRPPVALVRCPEQPPQKADARALASWYGPISVEIEAGDKDGLKCSGSGVLVSGDGLVLTCEHIIGGPRLTAVISEGPWKGRHRLEVVFANQKNDVALLRAEGLQTTRWAPVRLTQPAIRGEAIVAIGNPAIKRGGSARGAVSHGIVASPEAERLGVPTLLADISVASGSSGGPLISLETGEVLGVVQAVIEEGLPEADGTVASSGCFCLAAPAAALGQWLGLKQTELGSPALRSTRTRKAR
jgi:hypothetical protein